MENDDALDTFVHHPAWMGWPEAKTYIEMLANQAYIAKTHLDHFRDLGYVDGNAAGTICFANREGIRAATERFALDRDLPEHVGVMGVPLRIGSEPNESVAFGLSIHPTSVTKLLTSLKHALTGLRPRPTSILLPFRARALTPAQAGAFDAADDTWRFFPALDEARGVVAHMNEIVMSLDVRAQAGVAHALVRLNHVDQHIGSFTLKHLMSILEPIAPTIPDANELFEAVRNETNAFPDDPAMGVLD